MRKYILLFLSFAGFFTALAGTKTSKFEPGKIWYDTDGKIINAHGGGILYHNKTYYWYGEFKGNFSTPNPQIPLWESYRTDIGGVSCYSSKDLYNWKFEGVVLAFDIKNKQSDLFLSNILERPKVIFNKKTKKFVMWLHVDSPSYAKAAAGVAISDSPNGKFEYKGSFRPNDSMSRDMTLFVDTDGKAYQICSSEENATLHINLLTDDYVHTTTQFKRAFIGLSREAPAVFKRNNKYYMISSGCTGWAPNQATIAVADSMLGNWKMIGNPCIGKDAGITFFSQSTHVLKVEGKKDSYIAMFDRWNSKELYDSRYVWLPITFDEKKISIPWKDSWEIK